MRLLNFTVGPDQPFFLIAGPCVVESEGLILDTAGKLKELTTRLGVPFIFKSSFDKANRSSRSSFRGPGMEEGLRILVGGEAAAGFARAHRRARGHAARRSRGGRRRAADARVPLPPDELHRQRVLAEAPGEHQEGPVPVAVGNAERRRQGALHRQRADHGVRARVQLRLQQSRLGHALACPSCAQRDVPSCSTRRIPCNCRAGRAAPQAGSASSCRCSRAPRWPSAWPACSWKLTQIPRRRCPTARMRGRCRAWRRC